jgi:hypothetical protein
MIYKLFDYLNAQATWRSRCNRDPRASSHNSHRLQTSPQPT